MYGRFRGRNIRLRIASGSLRLLGFGGEWFPSWSAAARGLVMLADFGSIIGHKLAIHSEIQSLSSKNVLHEFVRVGYLDIADLWYGGRRSSLDVNREAPHSSRRKTRRRSYSNFSCSLALSLSSAKVSVRFHGSSDTRRYVSVSFTYLPICSLKAPAFCARRYERTRIELSVQSLVDGWLIGECIKAQSATGIFVKRITRYSEMNTKQQTKIH